MRLRSRLGAYLIREERLESLTGVGVDHLFNSLRMDVLQPHTGDISGRPEMQKRNLRAFLIGTANVQVHADRLRDNRRPIPRPALFAQP